MPREPGPRYLARQVIRLLRSGDVTVTQRKRMPGGKYHFGHHDPDGRIIVSKHQSRDERRRTTIHETLHENEDRKAHSRATEEDIERRTLEVDAYLSPRRRGVIEFFSEG